MGGFFGRGLTLEGLTMLFLLELQRHMILYRWGGGLDSEKYEDLIRVHLTSERYSCFRHLAVVEDEIDLILLGTINEVVLQWN